MSVTKRAALRPTACSEPVPQGDEVSDVVSLRQGEKTLSASGQSFLQANTISDAGALVDTLFDGVMGLATVCAFTSCPLAVG